MATYNAENERTKRRYLMFLKDARRHGEASLDKVAAAIHRFEVYTRFRDFRSFRIEQATAFKRHLAEQVNAQTRQPLSKATLYSTLMALKNFFQWLAGQPGYRSRMSYADAEYFNLSEADTRTAKASIDREGPTLEQVLHVIGAMAHSTEIEKRDRAVVAFALLSGARDDAIASMKLKHVDLDAGRVDQDARDVRTKFRKTFQT
jgi:site-specific recombinase XerC